MIQVLKTRSERGTGISTQFFNNWISRALGRYVSSCIFRKRRIACASWCYKCTCLGEDVDNLLLHCQVATWLWSVALKWFGILRVIQVA